jgi:hypothetical protein
MKPESWSRRLADRPVRGRGEYPIGTIAFSGPTNRHASKVAVGIVRDSEGVDELERWFQRKLDVRVDSEIGSEVEAFLRRHGVRRVVVAKGILGCPHEEGVDYPDGEDALNAHSGRARIGSRSRFRSLANELGSS